MTKIKVDENYFHKIDLSEFRYTKDKNGTDIWIHDKVRHEIEVVSHEEMQLLMDSGHLFTSDRAKQFMKRSVIKSKKLLEHKLPRLIGEFCYVKTSLQEEYFFYLEKFDFTSNSFETSLLDYKYSDMKEFQLLSGEPFSMPADFTSILRKMTKVEIDEHFGDIDKDAYSLSSITFDSPFPSLILGESDEESNAVSEIALPKDYMPSLVNSSIGVEELYEKLKVALSKDSRPDAITILMSGPPGVGKTLAAKFITNKLGIGLKTFQLGELLHKYVGETEKALMEAFKEATEKGHAILIDEADSISPDREGTDRKHQAQMVNSLLQAMDSFKGIAFFTTNFKKTIDKAVMRRVLLEVEFKNLTGNQADKFASKFFPRRKIKGLQSGVYSPSDFSKVKDGLIFVDDNKVNKQLIIERLKLSAESRNGDDKGESYKSKVGFDLWN